MSDDPLHGIDPDNNPSVYASENGGRNVASYDLVSSTIGLSSQIQRLLQDPDLLISVTTAEPLPTAAAVIYTIKLSLPSLPVTVSVKRRYREFRSLRSTLLHLFPTLIIPPIPEKHSLLTYLVSSINTSRETLIVESRKRCFTRFLVDLVRTAEPEVAECLILVKFLDPNYELCWDNALNEPPANLIPSNMLLANPIDPTDQNGLYSLLPSVNGFDFNASIDNLKSLRKLNDDLHKLARQIHVFDTKSDEYYKSRHPSSNDSSEQDHAFPEIDEIVEENVEDAEDEENYDEDEGDDSFVEFLNNKHPDYLSYTEIPESLQKFEAKFHHLIKNASEVDKVNAHTAKDYKLMIDTLIELGANLNNFSLQVFESQAIAGLPSTTPPPVDSFSLAIEKFGSTIDNQFLSLEVFVKDGLVPEWQEPVHQIVQYYLAALNLIKFFKFKIVQLKILYRLKFAKFQQLADVAYVDVSAANTSLEPNSLDHLKGLNSPVLAQTLNRIESQKSGGSLVRHKKSWYGLFGGGNGYSKQPASIARDKNGPPHLQGSKKTQLERDLHQLGQLLELANRDMFALTSHLTETYCKFTKTLEKRWLELMIAYVQKSRNQFEENLETWKEFRLCLSS